MSNIENLKGFDPFADAAKGDDEGVQDGLVHVRIQQRNGRKTLTTVQGLSAEYDLKVRNHSMTLKQDLLRRIFYYVTNENTFLTLLLIFRKLCVKLRRNLLATAQLLNILNTEKYFSCKETSELRYFIKFLFQPCKR